MAERQTVFRWLRQNLAALIAGITLTAITVGTIDASTITVDAIVAGDASLGVTQAAGAVAVTATGAVTVGAGSVTMTATTIDLETTDVLTVGNGAGGYHNYSTLSTSGGFDTSTSTFNAGGIALAASGAGDDISIDAADDAWIEGGASRLTLDDTSGAVLAAPLRIGLYPGGTAYDVGVNLAVKFNSVANTTGGGTADLAHSAVIPATALNADHTTGSNIIRVEYVGEAAANANAKTISLRADAAGACTCADSVIAPAITLTAATQVYWSIVWTIYRSATDNQKVIVTERTSNSSLAPVTDVTYSSGSTYSFDDASEWNFCTCLAGVSASDLTAKFLKVSYE